MGGTVEETATYNGDVDQDEYSDSEEEGKFLKAGNFVIKPI